ncbi:MAG: hypothetical protein H7335_05795 [Massilia sp.]|nr:hypothetical protein [Massilia sp.]
MRRTQEHGAPLADPLHARQSALEAENAALRQRQVLLENAIARYAELVALAPTADVVNTAHTTETAETADLAESRLRSEISHELRQPLSALAIYASVLKSHVAPAGQPLLAQIKTCLTTLSALLAK